MTRDWLCPSCHHPLGVIQRGHMWRCPYIWLTINQRAIATRKTLRGRIIVCICGGERLFTGDEIRERTKH